MKNDIGHTTIRVEEGVKASLDEIKIIPDEKYNSVIKRLISGYKKGDGGNGKV